MTFHKLVKTIYEECLHDRTKSYFATDEEIQTCIDLVRNGRVALKFKAIFIDEIQNFDPLYLELCYLLLESGDDSTFLMAGDLNQTVRAQSRRGDVPWKRINGVKLDFTGRVKYIDKNYRNSREISEYIYGMLNRMNSRLSMLGMINTMEYEYNSFTMGQTPTIALKVKTGINRMSVKREMIAAIKEIVTQYQVSYSDIAILFPFGKQPLLKYYLLHWLQQGLEEADIPYSLIIPGYNRNERTKYYNTSGVVVSTIESSLGLDFKAVILAGLFPYNYLFLQEENKIKKIRTWNGIKEMAEQEQNLVQSQMRSIYAACSRSRDILYVLSDLAPESPMEEVITKRTEQKLLF